MLGTCDSANADPLPRIAGYVRPKRVSDDVDLVACHVIILLQNISIRRYIKGPGSRDQYFFFLKANAYNMLNNCILCSCFEWNRKLCKSFVVEHKNYFCEMEFWNGIFS